MNKAEILVGNALKGLQQLPDGGVRTCVTSPPYWGLRDYGTGNWVGGDPACSHRRESKKSDKTITGHKNFTEMLGVGDAIYKSECPRCGAVREDEQLGLEATPQEFVENLCRIFDEVWRVLADDGTVWVNLGDSYNGAAPNRSGANGFNDGRTNRDKRFSVGGVQGLKPKDLVGIPWRFAFAMQDRGWYLRQDIIWAKPNPMPESVTDRCTKSHEYIFLFSKQPKYFFDHEAIKEPLAESSIGRLQQDIDNQVGSERAHAGAKTMGI
jgi:DNA modification methylase